MLMCVTPGGALREDLVPQQRSAQTAAAFAGLSVPSFSPSAALLKPHLCGLASFRRANMEERELRMVAGRSLLSAAVPMGLRSGRAAAYSRTGPLSMTEKEKASKKTPAEKKSPEEVTELNSKLWAAAETGDAELIRKLVEDGAEVNSAPFVADEDDDDDEGDYSSSPPSELSNESSMPEATVSSDGTVEKPTEETPEQRKKRRKKEKARKKKLAAANKGPSALHLACEGGHSDAACALVDLGADVNCLTSELLTPLHCAVAFSCQDTVQVLVTLGADLKAKNQQGETPVATGERLGTYKQVLSFLQQFTGLVD